MTRPVHNITSSEAFTDGAHILVQQIRPRRRRGAPLGFPVWVWAVTGWAGLIVSVDFHLGMPLCLSLTLGGMAAVYFWRKAA